MAGRRLWSVDDLLGPTSAAKPERRDRRRLPRGAFSRQIPAFLLEDPPILELRGRDLSLEGVGVEPVPELGVGKRVHLALARESGVEPLLVWARVVRAEDEGAGLCFETPGDLRDRERLATLVAGLTPVSVRVGPGGKRVSA